MFRIDHPTAVAVKPAPGAAGVPGFFTGGDPVGGIPATVVTQDWANLIQEELISILTEAGVTPDKTATNQVLLALQAMGLKIATTAQAQGLTDDATIITPKKLADVLNSHALGMGQAWQNVKASRNLETNYTNTSGRAISVIAMINTSVSNTIVATVDGVIIQANGSLDTKVRNLAISVIVPPGAVYKIGSSSHANATLSTWVELR